MTYYIRDLEKTLSRYSKFPVVAILGPRQSGKTTLAKNFFKNHIFLNLDDLELRNWAQTDPKAFLRKHENENGLIIDEFQNAPDLLSYIKVIVDSNDRPGYFILTGSQNFLMDQAISQSLAGRVGILTLLPFSINELIQNDLIEKFEPEQPIFIGGYPRLYINDFQPLEVYPSYIRTYLERDVRQLINTPNLYVFQKFIKLCAARIGQLLNFSDLAVSCGISVPTVNKWLSILESSYIIFLLKPHWNNFNKRITKTPKIYFYDTGIACSLLEINSKQSLALSPHYSHLFECFIIADLFKQYYNKGLVPPIYFWRDKNGELEIDCIIEKNSKLIPIEIKSGETFNEKFFDSLNKWRQIAQYSDDLSYLIYGGNLSRSTDYGHLISWNKSGKIVDTINE